VRNVVTPNIRLEGTKARRIQRALSKGGIRSIGRDSLESIRAVFVGSAVMEGRERHTTAAQQRRSPASNK
jgi:hypothetical protein